MDEQRAEFEAWAKSKGAPKDGWWIRQIDDGGYSCHAVDMAWDAWQAATQRQQERIAELEADIAHKDAYAEQLGRLLFKAGAERQELEAQVQALSLDAELWRYSVAIGENQSMNWLDVHDDWNGEGDFADAIKAAIAAGKGEG